MKKYNNKTNKKEKIKKILTIIIAILLFIVVGFVNYYIYDVIINSDMPTWWKILVLPN